MINSALLLRKLFLIRNHYGSNYSEEKLKILNELSSQKLRSKKLLLEYHDVLLFLIAYPDNNSVYNNAIHSLQQLQLYIHSKEKLKDNLYNSGITHTNLCAAFSFEIVKWFRKKYPDHISLISFDAVDGQIQSALSVVMPKVESEILQDANENWRTWFKQIINKGEDILDRLITIFDQADIRPEIRDELWGALGINVEINFPENDRLSKSLISPYYHRSIVKKNFKHQGVIKPIKIVLNETETEKIIECARTVLMRQLREIDPITFTSPELVSYYQMPRGISIALMGMEKERRSPIDSYMGYVVFKNGLPVAYAGSWILFDSGRIGINVFPAYRGGESQFIFEQVLKLHQQVYKLNRFTVDPYQIGKENKDGIHSGAFWLYYRAGFRPIRKEQKQLAETEAAKLKSIKGHRTTTTNLKILADSRSELIMNKKAVRFDATDLSRVYARILKTNHNNNRKPAEDISFRKLVRMLHIKNYHDKRLQFVLKNWAVLLMSKEKELLQNKVLKKNFKKYFELKANGKEEEYITALQKDNEFRKLLEKI